MGNRIYYAVQQVGIKPASSGMGGSFTAVHGLQSAGIATSFTNAPIQSLGQLSLYEIKEDVYEIQISLKKVLDGYSPIYCLATADSLTPELHNRMMSRCTLGMSIFDDTAVSFAQGSPLAVLQCSGLFISSIRYNFDIAGNFEEEVSLVGDNKIWSNDWRKVSADKGIRDTISFPGAFNNNDSPIALEGINRRQDMVFGNSVDNTTLPTEIPSDAHITAINVSTNINREAIVELGRKTPWFRLPVFPVEVITEITTMGISGDNISVTESGILTPSNALCSNYGNIDSQTIRIATCEGTRIYLGDKNKLSSVNYQGGDAGGGNVKLSYTYKGYNDFVVLHSGESTFWTERADWLAGIEPLNYVYNLTFDFGDMFINDGVLTIT